MSQTITISLGTPVEFKAGKYPDLNLREFTVGEWAVAEAQSNPTPIFIKLISLVSAWPEEAVSELPWTQFDEATAFLGEMLNRSYNEPRSSIDLDTPIEFNGKTYDTLALREFKAGEKSKAETHATRTLQDIQLMSFVSGWPVPAIRRLPITKFEEGRAFLLGFIRRGPATGES